MAAIVHGWCGFVEKSNDVVFQQMVINKLWIADDVINEIKDYLYISAAEVLRKFYRAHVNRSITDMWVNYTPLTDIYGRDRQAIYAIGHVYGGGNIQIQGTVCLTCGDFDHLHNNMNGCCPQQFDPVDEPIYLVDDYWGPTDEEITDQTIDSIEAEADEPEIIPEVSWAVDIPKQPDDTLRQTVLDNWNQTADDAYQEAIRDALSHPNLGIEDDYYRDMEEEYYRDMASEAADYAEYMNELRMEEYADRR
jgi:hypothetical protein